VIGIALLGAGYAARIQLRGWLRVPNARVVGLWNRSTERGRALAGELDVPCFDDLQELVRHPDVSAVDVATALDTHLAMTRVAAAAGKHVLCQKPLAPTLVEARAMVDTCERAGVRFMVAEMWRHLPWFRDLRRHLDAGAIGEPYHLRVVGARRAMRRESPVNENQPYFAAMPMLIVYEMMIHWIDPARYLLGEVETVYARTRRVNPAIAGEDWALVVLAHADGATSQLDGSWANDAEPPGPTREGDVVLEGTDGVLHVAPHERELRLVRLGGETTVVARYPDVAESFQRAFDGCIGDFADAVRAGRPFESSAADNLKTLGATLAAYESARIGQVARP
jgi:predicted dehydrogenase